jgi:hypothetical protein
VHTSFTGDETILPDSWFANAEDGKGSTEVRPAAVARPMKHNSVIDFCSSAMLLEKFQESNEQLEEIQQRLNVFLQSKRALFPRFYFLADDELLLVGDNAAAVLYSKA